MQSQAVRVCVEGLQALVGSSLGLGPWPWGRDWEGSEQGNGETGSVPAEILLWF